METRICIKCGIKKKLIVENFETNKDGVYHRNVCRKCRKEQIRIYSAAYREENREQLRLWQKSYKKTERSKLSRKKYTSQPHVKAKVLEAVKQYQRCNPEKIREWKRLIEERNVKTLNTNYIKRLLTMYTSLRFEDIPENLVELKRKQLKLERHVKKQKNNNSAKDDNVKNTKKSH